MYDFAIAETKSFGSKIPTIDKKIYQKIKDFVYPQLKNNPFFGANIKKLKGELSGLYRYRIGDYRLFYTIDRDKVVVIVIDLKLRKDAYK